MEENESTYYAQIPITVMYDSRLKPIERLLYGTIAMLTKKSGYCYANNGYLAELYKCSEMAISKYIKNLSFYGYITIANANSYKRQIYLSDLKQMIKEPITNDIGTYNKRYRNLKQTYEHNNNNKLNNNLKRIVDINNTNVLFDQQELVEPEKPKSQYSEIMEAWNRLPVTNIKAIKGTRLTMLKARLKDYTIDEILSAISNIRESPFLLGQNNKGWQITFDWFIRPNNFIKVYEGNYTGKRQTKNSTSWNDAQAGYEGAMQDLEGLIDE